MRNLKRCLVSVLALALLLVPQVPSSAQSSIVFTADFEVGTNGFRYQDDLFDTAQPLYSRAARPAAGGFDGPALQVTMGGRDDADIVNMSGGWQRSFVLRQPTAVEINVRYNLARSGTYEADEFSQALVAIDGALLGPDLAAFAAQLAGDGNEGPARETGWRAFRITTDVLAAGTHTLALGGFSNKKTLQDETTTVSFDDVVVRRTAAPTALDGASAIVDTLDYSRFRANIQQLASFGDRTQGSASYNQAASWMRQQLEAAGYTVETDPFTYNGGPRENMYVTKVGTTYPDRMYIVSAHLDGRGGGGGADDDASGASLVLEAARAFAQPGFETEVTVRFVLWNAEEVGLIGSRAYAETRQSLQGLAVPADSTTYPEPNWLGVVQHDMILFDHGLPTQPQQIPGADIDVEFQQSSSQAGRSQQLAARLQEGNRSYSTDYPADVGNNMRATDSASFQNMTASVSVRENTRDEIGQGSNPHYHQASDLFSTYSEADFQLGFNTVQMTVGTIAELARTSGPGDTPPPPPPPTATPTPTVPAANDLVPTEPIVVPGLVQAENFLPGDPGVAYVDDDVRNFGLRDGQPNRPGDVDVYATVGEPGFIIGRTRTGEWTEYNIEADRDGTYRVSLRYASGAAVSEVGSATVTIDGRTVGTLDVQPTGAWWDFRIRPVGTIDLTQGVHRLRVTWGDGGQVNFDRLGMQRVAG